MRTVVYIPGLGYEQNQLSVKAYALRMLKAIDEQNPDAAKTYSIESSDREFDGDGSVSDVVSLYELDAEQKTEIYRFYEFRYGTFLTEKFVESNVLVRFTTLLLVLIGRLYSVAKSLFSFRDEVKPKSKIQALYFTFVLILVAAYLVSMIPAFLALLASYLSHIEYFQQIGVLVYIEQWQEWFVAVIASFSAFMLLSPDKKGLFASMATEYFAANQYLSIGDRRLLIMGKLNRLIEVISEELEQKAPADNQIEIHGYSFGSILALDLLFPYEYEPNTRVKQGIHKLVTVGCPFDFVEIYWKNYFSDRKYSELALNQWQNINSDMDVLSSKFDGLTVKQNSLVANEDFWQQLEPIDITFNMVHPKRVSYWQMLMFYGIKAHQMYWDQHIDSRSCLVSIVEEVNKPDKEQP